MAELRQYQETEWAVKRWDWFNGGRIIEPKSFCQFWRTVVVWATLAKVLPFLRQEEERQPEIKVREYVPPPAWLVGVGNFFFAVRAVVAALIGAVWSGIRCAGGVLLRLLGSLVVFIDDHSKTVGQALRAVLLVGTTIMLLVLGAAFIYLAITETVLTFGVLGGAVGSLCAVVLVFAAVDTYAPQLAKILFSVCHLVSRALNFAASVAHLMWDFAVMSKKQVCPPMEIIREEEASNGSVTN